MMSAPRIRFTEILKRLEAETEAAPETYRYRFGESDRFEIGIANDRAGREEAWGLVYRAYLQKGYMAPSDSRMRILPQDALPGTTTFVAREADGSAAATLTMVPDSPMGLPMDDLYRRELDALRAAGRRPCEIAKLVACVEERQGMEMLLHLFKLAYLSARRLDGCTDFVITVNPRHEKYYRRLLLFEPIGETRAYGSVNGAEAVPLRLDLLRAEELYRQAFGGRSGRANLHAFFVGDDEPAILDWLGRERTPLSEADLRYFFAERSDILGRVTPAERLHLQDCYLAYDLEAATAPGLADAR
ncbi:MAG TPA: hypothetical protein PK280_05205 [Planctomycetota bacterium]|nr:hypothetical protein [Planctomycetota bacterium]